MSSSQMLMVIGSIFLLSLLIVNFYSTNTEQMLASVGNETIIAATGIGQSLLDDIQNRAFDEFTVSNYTSSADSLTAANSLGPESGELSPTSFDDIDDFNGYSAVDSSTRLGSYGLTVDVFYIVNMIPDSAVNFKTFVKQVDVKVFNLYMTDTLTLSHVIGY